MSWFKNLVTDQLWEVSDLELTDRLRSNPDYQEIGEPGKTDPDPEPEQKQPRKRK